jgi:putative endonuclease
MYFVYILRCSDGSLYTGITTDVKRRLEEHKVGIGSRYTRAKKGEEIVYVEECENRSIASKRENQIKRMDRKKKLELFSIKKPSLHIAMR